MSHDDMKRLFEAGRADDENTSPRRVDSILKRARREVAAQDILTFSLVSIWSTLFRLIEVLFQIGKPRARVEGRGRRSRPDHHPHRRGDRP